MKILIKDDYFSNPNYLREIALYKTKYREDNEIGSGPGGWRGKRSFPIRLENTLCPCCYRSINYTSDIDKFLSIESKKIFDLCCDFYNLDKEWASITTYFHITTEKTRYSLDDFSQQKFHMDDDSIVAGIVYLTPDAPLSAGTSILDGDENKFLNIQNKYNRLVAYEGNRIHGLSDVFGDTDETGRMTFTFFIQPPRNEQSYLSD